MGKNKETSELVDAMLKLVAFSGVLSVGIVAPNAIQALDKPLKIFFSKLDKRSREREYYRLVRYMRQQNLLSPVDNTKNYQHGLILSEKGLKRVKQANINSLTIDMQDVWDEKWRIVLFDIPEVSKRNRDYFTTKLKSLGFVQLQRSVWIHSFPCREKIASITEHCGVRKYITYIETSHIDSSNILKTRYNFKF